MPRGRQYSDEERDLIYKMRDKNYTPKQIADELKRHGYDRTNRQISYFLYDNKDARVYKKAREVYEACRKNPRVEVTAPAPYEDTIAELKRSRDKMIDVRRDHFSTVGHIDNESATKVLILTDLHIPFELDDVIQHAMENHGDADILILGGDMIEAYSVSMFRKSKAILFRWEYECALKYIEMFAKTFPQVLLVSGNHERRVKRYVSSNLGNMLHGLVHDDPMRAMADGLGFDDQGKLTKLHDFPNVHYDGWPRGDYVRVGNLVVAHPDNYSTVSLRTVINAAESLLGLEEFECLVLGHTHAQGSLIWRNRLLIEAGCCCQPLEYTFATGKFLKLPQTFGYVVAHLDKDGHVDFDRTRTVYQGVGRITKPPALDYANLS